MIEEIYDMYSKKVFLYLLSKYDVGNIVCLNNGKTVYIFAIDDKERKYQVSDTGDEIFMKHT